MDDSRGSPPMSRRRVSFWVGAVAALVLAFGAGFAAHMPIGYPPAALRAEMERQVRQATGLVATRDGPARLVLFPQPHVEIEDVGFADPTGGIRLTAEALDGYPRLLSLLAGRLELANVALRKPDLVVDLDSNVPAADSAIGRAAAARPASQEAVRADAARLGVVVLEDGRVTFRSHAAPDATLDGLNATLDWRNLGAPISLTGRAHVNHRPTDLALWIGAPAELLRGGSSAVRLRLNSDTLTLFSSGNLASAGGPTFRGRLSATGASLHDVAALLGYDLQQRPQSDSFSVRSDVDFTGGRLVLSSLRLQLLQNDFEGAIAIETHDRRRSVSGTLAADTLQLDPFMPDGRIVFAPDGGWSTADFPHRALDLVDLDLRVSATHAALGDLRVANAALSLMTRRGAVEIGVADVAVYGGHVRGRLVLQGDDEGITGRLSAAGMALDLAAAPWAAAAGHAISGQATGTVGLEGTGRDMADVVAHLTGHGELTVERGALAGIDVEQALRRADKRPAGALATVAGRTPFSLAKIAWHVADGVLKLDDASFSGPGSRIDLGGHIDLCRRAADLTALARQAGTDGVPSEAGARVGFLFTAAWPEARFELRETRPASGASEPLP